jgi:hypothetical protein
LGSVDDSVRGFESPESVSVVVVVVVVLSWIFFVKENVIVFGSVILV